MRIKITKGCVAGMAAHSVGDEIEVSGREGLSLIAMGKAIEVSVEKVEPVMEQPTKEKLTVKKKAVKKKAFSKRN